MRTYCPSGCAMPISSKQVCRLRGMLPLRNRHSKVGSTREPNGMHLTSSRPGQAVYHRPRDITNMREHTRLEGIQWAVSLVYHSSHHWPMVRPMLVKDRTRLVPNRPGVELSKPSVAGSPN